MSRPFFIANIIFSIVFVHCAAFGASLLGSSDSSPIIITSDSLTADNKNSTAIFEGSVVAKTDDVTMYSDKMTVYYDNSANKVKKISAVGNVRVNKEERALFSDKALYLADEEKILFTGNPKAVEGENVISGTQITFYLKDERVEVEGSRVVLQNKQGPD